MTLDPAGLEAAAKALEKSSGDSEECCPEIGGCGGTHTDCWYRSRAADTIRAYSAAVLPPDESEAAKAVAAGRAAASPDPPDMTNMCEGESPDHKPGITPAASPDERLREAGEQLANLVTLLGGYDGPGYLAAPNQGEHPDYYAAAKLFDRIMRDEKTGAAVVLAQWRAALAAADREAPDEGGGAMSEFRVVDANGDPYPPHAQPCRTLAAAALRRDFYQQVTSVSGEARMPVRPLRIERRSAVVSMWEPWNVGAASGLRKGASDE